MLSVLWVVSAAAGFSPVQAEPVPIDEWRVPWDNTRPRDPYVDGQGRVWFCGQAGGYLATLDPESGQFKKYDLGPGAGPHNLIVDEADRIWFAGNRNAYIGRLDPATGKIRKFPMPDPEAGDPHTLVFAPSGDIWFTVQWGNFIGRLRTDTGKIDLVKVPTPNARPYGIRVDSRGRPWVMLFGTHKIGTVDLESMRWKAYALPRPEARPRRNAIASDGSVWYADYAGGFLGRFEPSTGKFKEWPLPGGSDARPYGMAVDDRDRLWLVETGSLPNRLVGFDPSTEKFFSVTPIPSGGGTVRHMYFHPPTRELWFGEDTNQIGRARLP
ncbi:MAG: lyase [Nitrospinaceae bacterium]|nr:lyase [Nitrospinaceae bacterium]NIR56939.1 lyase [Nitrospinaceae bacterium]NIS87395.1 lyase [Nitrospinaceae bacterium]NIT84247.1 lyase [Nitrospinaceae bacterium]NIU46435.1 lyase [Nitrospinaceae bacterium]